MRRIKDMTVKERDTIGLFVVIVGDAILTLYMLIIGFTEINPGLQWFIELTNETYMTITKILMGLLTLILVYKRKESEKYIHWGLRAYFIIYMAALLVQWGILYCS